MRLLLAAVAVAIVATAVPSAAAPESAGAGAAAVVVADVDHGINPYHEAYYSGSELYRKQPPNAVTPAVLARFPGVRSIRLTRTGD